ncbi:MAG: TolC family protein [Sulfuricurvum sp.]|nr:TolC family protein [Sulfuricurvum sp.]
MPHLFATTLTFNDALLQFIAHNYDLQIARQEVEKSKSDLTIAERHPNPILSGSYDYFNVQHHFKDVSSSATALATFHVDYPIELGNKRTRRIESANANIAYTNFLMNETQRQQLFTFTDAYYKVSGDEIDLKNAIDNHHDFENIITIAKAKYDHGFLSEIDLDKIQLQLIDYDQEIEEAKTALASDKESLVFLLALKSDDLYLSPLGDTEPLTYSMDELIVYAQKHRADCLAAQENIKAANATVELEKANAIPDLTIGMETENYAPTYDGLLIGINFSIPIPVYDKNQGAIQKSRITALQSLTQESKTINQTALEVRQSFFYYKSQESIYQSMLHGYKSAKYLKEKQDKVFALKAISILELLDAQKNYREYQKKMIHAFINLHIAAVHLKLTAALELNQ